MSPRATKTKKTGVKKRVVKKKTASKAKKSGAKKKTVKKKVAKKQAVKKKIVKKKVVKKKAKAAAKPVDLQAQRAARAAYRKLLRQAGQLLEAKRQSLIQAYNNTKGNTRNPSADGTEDYIDYAVSSYDRDFMLSLTEMERKQLMLVEEALQRVRRKTYGRCLQCGQEIPAPRLQVEPWARHCIRCQELEEQGLLEELSELGPDEEEADEGQAVEGAEDAGEDTGAKDDEEEEEDDEVIV